MTQLTTCPGCEVQILLPQEAAEFGPAECPHCQVRFELDEVVRKTLSTAKLLPVAEDSHTDTEAVAERPRLSDTLNDLSLETILGTKRVVETAEVPTSDQRNSETLANWESRLKRAMGEDAPADQEPSEPPEVPASLDADPPPVGELPTEDQQEFTVPKIEYPTFEDANQLDVDENEGDDSAENGFHDQHSIGAPIKIEGVESVNRNSAGGRKRRSTRRKVFSLAASACLGVVGIGLGLYALLWIKGPAADHFQVAQYLPNALLPPSMQTAAREVDDFNAVGEPLAAEPEDHGSEPESIADDTVPVEQPGLSMMRDEQVQVVAAELPVIGVETPSITSEEFHDLVNAAQLAVPEMIEGDLSTKESVARKGRAYMALCRLAEKLPAVEESGVDDHLAFEAREVFAGLASDSAVRGDLQLIASRWWSYLARPTPGAFLIGHVERVEESDAGPISHVRMGDATISAPIPVLWDGTHRLGQQAAVIGSIVLPDAEQASHLPPDIEQIVVAIEVFPVD